MMSAAEARALDDLTVRVNELEEANRRLFLYVAGVQGQILDMRSDFGAMREIIQHLPTSINQFQAAIGALTARVEAADIRLERMERLFDEDYFTEG